MVFKHVCKEVPAMGQTRTADGRPATKQLLRNLSGAIRPGEVAALMVRAASG